MGSLVRKGDKNLWPGKAPASTVVGAIRTPASTLRGISRRGETGGAWWVIRPAPVGKSEKQGPFTKKMGVVTKINWGEPPKTREDNSKKKAQKARDTQRTPPPLAQNKKEFQNRVRSARYSDWGRTRSRNRGENWFFINI